MRLIEAYNDGAIGSRTAAMKAPYLDADTSGHLYLTAEQVRDHVVGRGVLTELLHGPSLGLGQWAGRTRPVTSPSVSATVRSTGSLSAYAERVLDDTPSAYFRMGDTSGGFAVIDV